MAAPILALVLLLAAVGVSVRLPDSRLVVQWSSSVSADTRAQAEREYGLVDPHVRDARPAETADPGTVVYRVIDPRSAAIARLSSDPAFVVVEGLERPLAEALNPGVRIELVPWRQWLQAFQPQSLIVLALAAVLLAGSRASSRAGRAAVLVLCVSAFAVLALRYPLEQSIRTGDYQTYTASRPNFEAYMGGEAVRFEAHLSSVLLRLIDARFGADASSPERAFARLSQLATLWFSAMAILAGWSGGFSSPVLRYLAIALAAPASLMYFGYRELGYLSLNVAAFPLVVQGIRGMRGRFEAGSGLFGFGAALHGFGLLSLAGTAFAAMAARRPPIDRVRLTLYAFAFGTSAYLVWIFVYVIVGLGVQPGHAGALPWRPLLVSAVVENRVNWAALSAWGGAEMLMACWMAGVALLAPALTAVRVSEDARPALAFSIPSVAFLLAFWPIQGIAVETDLLFAAFPALFALAWCASQSIRATVWALLLLVSSHVVFWRVVLSDIFVANRVF